MDNIKIFKDSLKNPDLDGDYYKLDFLVISKDPKEHNSLMKANASLIENISVYKVALESNNKRLMNTSLKNITKLLEVDHINYSEFVSYWPLFDMSHSVYKKLSLKEKCSFLAEILPQYIEHRHSLYSIYGYSPSTLQVKCDSFMHKRGGSLGNKKISLILEENGFSKLNGNNIEEFLSGDMVYIFPDKGDYQIFTDLAKKIGVNSKWSYQYPDKKPDCIFKKKQSFYIMEHKHKKEGGGGQNDQIAEVINLIRQKEKDKRIHYIGYLDGIYLNKPQDQSSGKMGIQINEIGKALENNPNNYFVNTSGFIKLLEII